MLLFFEQFWTSNYIYIYNIVIYISEEDIFSHLLLTFLILLFSKVIISRQQIEEPRELYYNYLTIHCKRNSDIYFWCRWHIVGWRMPWYNWAKGYKGDLLLILFLYYLERGNHRCQKLMLNSNPSTPILITLRLMSWLFTLPNMFTFFFIDYYFFKFSFSSRG